MSGHSRSSSYISNVDARIAGQNYYDFSTVNSYTSVAATHEEELLGKSATNDNPSTHIDLDMPLIKS